jgi:lipoprotein-anchoring transpeptidase ErfK/SrfK
VTPVEKRDIAKHLPPTNSLVLQPPALATNTGSAEPRPIEPLAEDRGKRPVKTLIEAQVALSRMGISCGSADGVLGSQTKAALRVFQKSKKLPVTGMLDSPVREQLLLSEDPFRQWIVTHDALARLAKVPGTWLGKSEAERLDYETILEMAAEAGHAHPDYVKKLNPRIDWNKVSPGQSITIPNVEYPPPSVPAAVIQIRLGEKTLEAFDDKSNLLVHFPCSIAKKAEKRPVGELHVISVVRNPNYVFNPSVFPESEEARRIGRKLVLPPGPNNPVGVAWIGLDKPGYGLHGTPRPEEVGRTESHGCFRLANWNADYLAGIIRIGTPVFVEP